MTTGLAGRLRDETRALHTEVERSALMQALLRGKLGLAAYCMLLRNLHPIYTALEAALERHAADPVLAPVGIAALFRREALARDLGHLHGASWPGDFAVLPAARRYAARLEQLSAGNHALLVAHAYVRYLGDLSGGQLLRRIVGESLPAAADAGTAFYDFGDAARTRELTQRFRAGLAAIDADAAQADAIVAEARLAFGWHADLFRELAEAVGLSAAVARSGSAEGAYAGVEPGGPLGR